MPVSRPLLRLLQVRELEEEQCRAALALAAAELRSLENAVSEACERARQGRDLMAAAVHAGSLPDRLAALEEVRAGLRHAEALTVRLRAAEREMATLRHRFLAKRTERRQAETLIETEQQRKAIAAVRRSQQVLDEWYRTRARQSNTEMARKAAANPGPQPERDVAGACSGERIPDRRRKS